LQQDVGIGAGDVAEDGGRDQAAGHGMMKG
jgi:hypothetical protein